jgi:hypothetical protein
MRYCGILALVAIICSIEVALSEGFFSSSASMALVATRRSQRRQQQQSPHAFNGQNKVDRMSSSHRFCLVPPGGASKSSSKTTTTTTLFVSKDGEAVTCPFTKTMTIFGSLWGSFGVIYILAKAVKRVIPIAMEPFGGGSLTFTPFQWRYARRMFLRWHGFHFSTFTFFFFVYSKLVRHELSLFCLCRRLQGISFEILATCRQKIFHTCHRDTTRQ